MRHVSTEQIVNYTDGTSVAERMAYENHLSACKECHDLSQEFQLLVTRLRNDSTFEPPTDLVRWGINLFQPVAQLEPVGALKKLIGLLVFDSFDQPMLAGVRRVGAPPRQLLFRAGEVDVDVKIESMEANNRITLVGQVLSNAEKFFDNTPVKLESHGIVRYKTRTNLVGEFSFDEVPKDTYHLSVDLPEGQITLFCVHRGNS
jgi:hypothetical protein